MASLTQHFCPDHFLEVSSQGNIFYLNHAPLKFII